MTINNFRDNMRTSKKLGRPGEVRSVLKTICVMVLAAVVFCVTPAFTADQAPPPPGPPGENAQVYTDPLSPFNEKMFWFNLRLDKYVIHPVASGYAKVLPTPAREAAGRMFDNFDVLPRFANNLFQLHMERAGTEVARFGINTTLGVVGLWDVADHWFGLKENPDDFGLTLGHYGVGQGPYLVLPVLGPSSIRDAVGRAADGAMNPMNYTLPYWTVAFPANTGFELAQGINYRSLNLNLFEEADRYAIDLYGAVQDGYMQRRASQLKKVDE